MKLYLLKFICMFKHITGKILLPVVKKHQRRAGIRTIAHLNDRINAALNRNTMRNIQRKWRKRKKNIRGEFGVNLAGYISAESGLGEAARSSIRALEEMGIPLVLNNVKSPHRQMDNNYKNITQDNPYCFNLIHVNIDEFINFYLDKKESYFEGRHNIGWWFWELPQLPAEWVDRFQAFDEIWAASDFCTECFSKVSPIPVVKIPLSIHIKEIKEHKRARWGLSDHTFVFLFVFDFYSVFERKNPLAAVEAFKLAFSPQEDVLLLLKCANSKSNPEARDRLMKTAEGLKVKLIDQYLNREDLSALMAASDCYVSLHRSEGFGLPLAEAMYLKKPVIATAYSGNMEFMNTNNSFPVSYRLVEVEKDYVLYKKGNLWAEPDIEQAARFMRSVYENRELARKVGEIASQDVKTHHSPRAVGEKILQRLAHYSPYAKGEKPWTFPKFLA